VAPTFDPYSALGVPRDATQAQISAARRRLSREYHPDVNSDPGAAARFAEIQQAFDLLSDPATRVEDGPPPSSPPVFPAASRSAPVVVRRRKSAGPAILGLVTLGFIVFWAFAVQGGGGGTPTPTETQTTPPVQPTSVPQVRAAAPLVTPAFQLSSQYSADTLALREAGVEGQPTLRGDELLLSVDGPPGSPSSCINVNVPAADGQNTDAFPAPAITEEPVGTVTVHGRAEMAFPAAIPGSYLVNPECQSDQSADSLIPLGSVTADNLGVIDLGHDAMVIFGAHTSGNVTTVSYGAIGDGTNYLYPPADDACIDSRASGSGQTVWQPVQDQVSQQVTSAYQWLRTGTMVFRDPDGQSPRGGFFFDCGLDTPDEVPTDVTVP